MSDKRKDRKSDDEQRSYKSGSGGWGQLSEKAKGGKKGDRKPNETSSGGPQMKGGKKDDDDDKD